MTKIEGSGSISQRHGSADPDPHQNVMDPQDCFLTLDPPPPPPLNFSARTAFLRQKRAETTDVPDTR